MTMLQFQKHPKQVSKNNALLIALLLSCLIFVFTSCQNQEPLPWNQEGVSEQEVIPKQEDIVKHDNTLQIETKENPDVRSMSVSTDKETYAGMESAVITVVIDSKVIMNPVTVALRGINARGSDRLHSTKQANINPGENSLVFSYTVPSCGSCSGVTEGEYRVYADLIFEGRVISTAETLINIIR